LPAPSLERMCWRPRQSLCEISFAQNCVAYLVRSFRTNARIRSLTTGTFNLIVKDRIAFRLSGAPSVQPDNLMWRGHSCPRRFCRQAKSRTHTDSFRPSSKPYKHTVLRKSRQRQQPTEFPRVFHIGKPYAERIVERRTPSSVRSSEARSAQNRSAQNRGRAALQRRVRGHPQIGALAPAGFSSTQRYGPPLVSTTYFGTCRSGRQKIEKRTFGGPCFEGTLQKPLILLGISFPNQVPWPGRLRAFNRA
jgi:hypothetical protein